MKYTQINQWVAKKKYSASDCDPESRDVIPRYATEVAREMLRFGFAEHNLHRIAAGCFAENVASAHVLKKIGMQREGCLREKSFFKDRWWGSLLYAILDREWLEQFAKPIGQ